MYQNMNNQNNNMFQNMNNNNMFQNMNNNNMFQNMNNQFNMNQNNNFMPNQMNMNMNFNPNMMNFQNMVNIMAQQNMLQQMMKNMIMMNNMNNMNNSNNNINNNFNPNNVNNNNNQNQEPQPKIQRGERTLEYKEKNVSQSNIINVTFHASSGLRVVMSVSRNTTMKKLFSLFAQKIGISESLLGTEIIFLFNAETLNVHEEVLISDKLPNLCNITVIDQNNVIGAK